MAWSFYFLLRQPEVMQKLIVEVDTVLGQRQPTFADVPQLPYARMVMQEALRLYSPVYWITRTAVEDDVIDGYHIPAGSLVAIMSHAIHHHPNCWPNPTTFDPDRFSPERMKNRHPLAWIPFGAGQRQCIGKEFSLMEGQLILAKVLQRFRLTAVPGKETAVHAATTIRPKGGVWVNLDKAAR